MRSICCKHISSSSIAWPGSRCDLSSRNSVERTGDIEEEYLSEFGQARFYMEVHIIHFIKLKIERSFHIRRVTRQKLNFIIFSQPAHYFSITTSLSLSQQNTGLHVYDKSFVYSHAWPVIHTRDYSCSIHSASLQQ